MKNTFFITENVIFRTVAAMDVAGRLMTDSKRLTDASLRGKALASRADLARLATEGSPAEKQALSEALGIDDWTKLDADSFNKKIVEFVENGGVERYKQLRELIKNADTLPEADARPMPKFMNMQKDGIRRYSDENSRIAVMKNGDTYRLYDYDLRTVSKELTRTEVNAALREYNTKKNAVTSMNQQNMQVTETVDGSVGAAVATDTNVGGNDITNVTYDDKRFAISKTKAESLTNEIEKLGSLGIQNDAGGKKIKILTDQYTVNKNIFSIKGRKRGEVNARIKAIPHFAEILKKSVYSGTDTEIRGLESDAKKGVKAIHRFTGEYGNYKVEAIIRDKGSKQYLYEMKFIEKEKSSQQSMTDKSASPAPKGDAENLYSLPQETEKVNTSTEKNISKVQAVEKSAAELDSIAKENIPEYSKLSVPTRVMIRKVLYDALASGYSESDAILFARVSARSGLHMTFSKSLCQAARIKGTKDFVYADGYYDPYGNRIVINPEGTRSVDALLIHELTHAIYKDKRGRIILERGAKNMSDKQKESIIKSYSKGRIALNAPKGSSAVIMDEMNAHYIEGQLKNKNLLEALLSEEPTLKDKILSFFKGASTDYAGNAELSGAAKRLFKRYKKLFDSFSAQNQDTNAYGTARASTGSDTIRFALMNDKTLSDNVDDVMKMSEDEALQNVKEGNFISIMKETPSVILENVKDAKNLEIIIRFDAFYLATRQAGAIEGHYHNYGEIMKKLPEIIANPEAIVRMDNNRLNLISELTHPKGNNNTVSVELNTVKDINSKNTKYNLVVSVFASKDNYVRNNLDKHGIKVEYQREDLSQVNPQLYKWLATINDKSSTNSIAQKTDLSTDISEKNSSKRFALPEGVDSEVGFEYNERQHKDFDKTQNNFNFSVREYSISEITELFQSANKNPELDELFDKAYIFCRDAGVTFSVEPKIIGDDGKLKDGVCRGKKIIFSQKSFNDKSRSAESKAKIILHEMLHASTVYAMSAYRTDTKNGEIKMPRDLYYNCKKIQSVYESIKDKRLFKGEYGIKNSLEMIAELSEPEFAEKLKMTYPSAWHQLLDAICKLLGINKSFSNYDKLSKAVDAILTVPDYELAETFNKFYDKSHLYYATDYRETNLLDDGTAKALPDTKDSVMIEVDPEYKPTWGDKAFSGWTASQIAFTNAQAGIETIGKKYGVKNIESLVQAARSGGNQAEEMIAGNQYRIGSDTKSYQGEGLEKILRPINKQGKEVKQEFFDYLFHYHNTSRMSLEQRSVQENAKQRDTLKKNIEEAQKLSEEIETLSSRISTLGRTKEDLNIKRDLRDKLAKLKSDAKSLKSDNAKLQKEIEAFVPLENKPVFSVTDKKGNETVVTAEQSKAVIKEYEKKHPDFKATAEKLWKFNQNLNQYRVDSGLISQDTFDYLAMLYPHYVPTYRSGATKGIGAIEGKYNIRVKPTVKTATGSTKDLLPPDVMIARQVMETVRAGRVNQLANALYEGALKSGDTTYIEVISREKVSNEALAELDPTEIRPKNNEVVFFRKGERITMRVAKEIFAGFDAFSPTVEIHNPLIM